ncbi:MAG: cytochrome c oxidase assembly protein [Hyphomicrobiales bacterium]
MTLASLFLATALAHEPGGSGPAAASPWTAADLAVIVPLGLSGGLYLVGLARLWRQAGIGRGISKANAASFLAGWLTLALSLLSPLHDLGETLFAAHMIQHVLLVAIAAPLLVLGRPGGALSWGLPKVWRVGIGEIVRARPVAAVWFTVTRPLIATALHGATVWAWHLPGLFDAALASPWLHWLEHASFLGTAAVFWWAMLGRPARVNGYGLSVACLFVTLLHSSFLGMLLTLSPRPWYAPAPGAAAWGLSALEDQQLAGLIMWVPGGILYTLAALALAGLWITRSARPVRARP